MQASRSRCSPGCFQFSPRACFPWPVVLGTAVAEHRFGPIALAAGLATSFTAIGLFVATIGYSIGLDSDVFRMVGAAMLAGFGVILMLPNLQAKLAVAAGPLSNWTQQKFGGRP